MVLVLKGYGTKKRMRSALMKYIITIHKQLTIVRNWMLKWTEKMSCQDILTMMRGLELSIQKLLSWFFFFLTHFCIQTVLVINPNWYFSTLNRTFWFLTTVLQLVASISIWKNTLVSKNIISYSSEIWLCNIINYWILIKKKKYIYKYKYYNNYSKYYNII